MAIARHLVVASLLMISSQHALAANCPETLNVSKKRLAEDSVVNLCQAYQGKVVLIVNTASKCGYTYQYEGLESLYRKYKDRGLVVLGFPSNNFADQEPGTEKQIQRFCRQTYSIQFPMFEKTDVAKGTKDPLYRTLAKHAGEYPQWNFHKYLLDRNGKLIASFPSRSEPEGEQIIKAIERLL